MKATPEDVTRKKREPTAEEMMRRARDQSLSLIRECHGSTLPATTPAGQQHNRLFPNYPWQGR
jgi:hypothetical protein